MASATPLPNHSCPLCGGPNACAPARSGSFDTPCWCREVKVSRQALARVDNRQALSCLCPRCAQAQPAHPADDEPQPPA